MSRCKSCAADIVWCSTTKGKRMPVDREPTIHGNVVPQTMSQGLTDGCLVHVDSGPELLDPIGQLRYTSHFATCADADEFRS